MTIAPAPTEQDFAASGITIHAATWQGPEDATPLVLLHGIWDTWRTFLPVAPALAEDRTVIALDLRGHGASGKPERDYRIADYAADVLDVLRQLPYPRVHLLGFSLGSMIALSLAAASDVPLERLVLEDLPYSPEQPAGARAPWFEYLLDLKRQPFERVVAGLAELNPTRDHATNEESARALIGTADGPFRAFLDGEREALDFPALAAGVRVPTLLLQADPAYGAALSDEGRNAVLARLANADFAAFPGAGHLIHGEQPALFTERVRAFLSATG